MSIPLNFNHLDDSEFVAAFENGSLDPSKFHHASLHLQLGLKDTLNCPTNISSSGSIAILKTDPARSRWVEPDLAPLKLCRILASQSVTL